MLIRSYITLIKGPIPWTGLARFTGLRLTQPFHGKFQPGSMFWPKSFTTNFAASSNYKMLGQQGKIVIEVLLEFYGINFVL